MGGGGALYPPMPAPRPIAVADGLPGISRKRYADGRSTRGYLSRVERGFLTYLERAPDAAALLRSA